MKDHSVKAAELFVSGCNCSQAVFVAFAEDCGIEEKTAMKLASSFGDAHYKLIQTLAQEYNDVHNTYICRELLGTVGKSSPVSDPRTAQYYKTRPCVKFVITASEILDKHFFNN